MQADEKRKGHGLPIAGGSVWVTPLAQYGVAADICERQSCSASRASTLPFLVREEGGTRAKTALPGTARDWRAPLRIRLAGGDLGRRLSKSICTCQQERLLCEGRPHSRPTRRTRLGCSVAAPGFGSPLTTWRRDALVGSRGPVGLLPPSHLPNPRRLRGSTAGSFLKLATVCDTLQRVRGCRRGQPALLCPFGCESRPGGRSGNSCGGQGSWGRSPSGSRGQPDCVLCLEEGSMHSGESFTGLFTRVLTG